MLGSLFLGSYAIKFYFGVPDHIKQSESGSKQISSRPPGLSHYKDLMILYGSVVFIGVSIMIGSIFKKDA